MPAKSPLRYNQQFPHELRPFGVLVGENSFCMMEKMI